MKTFPLLFTLSLLIAATFLSTPVFAQGLPTDFEEKVRAEYNSISQEVIENELQLSFAEYLNGRINSYRSRQKFYATILSSSGLNDLCANGTFESGQINAADWSFYWEGEQGSVSGTNMLNTGSFNSGGPHIDQVHHQAVSVGPDPFFSAVGELDRVWNFPTSNDYSLRLGNANPRWGLESVAKKIVVTPANATLSFSYAIVTDNPAGHGNALPFFEVNIIDAADNNVNYNSLINLGNSSNRISSDNPLLIPTDPNANRRWKDWTCVTADLSSLMGDTVIVEFVNRDCWAGAHWSYTYIDNLCESCEGAPGDEGSIRINQVQSDSCGIPGQICIDYTLPNGSNANLDLVLEIIQNGTTVHTLNSPTLSSGSTYCFNLTAADTSGLDGTLPGFDFKVTGYPAIGAFNLTPQIIGNSSSGHLPGNNNDYSFACPQLCGGIVRDTLDYACEDLQSIPYTFTFVNNSGLPVNGIVITGVTPTGTTISPNSFNLPFPTVIPDGGTYGPVTVNINLLNPLIQPTEVCFTVKYLSSGTECCAYEHCITITPPDPCAQTSVQVSPTEDCCYDLILTNDFCPDYFTGVVTEVLTPGVIISNLNGGTAWRGARSANGRVVRWQPNNGRTIPMGTLPPMNICLDSITSVSQMPQQVVVHWMRGQEIVCTDTLELDCTPCAVVDIKEVICNDDGTVSFTYTVTNTSGQLVTGITVQPMMAGIDFDPFFTDGLSIPPNSAYTGTITISPNGGILSPGQLIPFKLTLLGKGDWCCHLEGLLVEIPDCTTACNCEDETFFDAVNAGVDLNIDCDRGLIRATTKLTNCDKVVLSLLNQNNQVVFDTSFAGDLAIVFPVLPNGIYSIEMEVYRIDENGEVCMESVFLDQITIDCSMKACCGSEDEFLEVIQAGYDVDFACEGINGPVVTFTPLAATDCDQVEWRIIDAAGNVFATGTSKGAEQVSFNVTELENFTLVTRWERFDENGESCFGFIERRQTIVNPCARNAGPIVITLAVKNNKTVTVQWEVDAAVSYQEYVVVREDKEDAQVIAKVLAQGGQTRYQYQDEAPLLGENKYVVYGLILEEEAGRSQRKQIKIQSKVEPEVKIMPNPTVQYAAVSMSEGGTYQVMVRDEFGRIHQRNQVNLLSHVPHQINLADYPAGIWLVQLMNEQGEVFTRRLVKLGN